MLLLLLLLLLLDVLLLLMVSAMMMRSRRGFVSSMAMTVSLMACLIETGARIWWLLHEAYKLSTATELGMCVLTAKHRSSSTTSK
jgi:hypothetical protein